MAATSRTFQCAVFKRGSNEAIPVVWDGSDFKLKRITVYNSSTSNQQLKWPFYTTITNEYSEDEAHVNVFRYYGTGSLGSLTGNTYGGDGVFAMLNGSASYSYLGLSGNKYTRVYYLAPPTSHGYTYPRWIGSQTASYIEDCRYAVANKNSGGRIDIDYAVLIKTNASFNTSHMAPALRVGVKVSDGTSFSSTTLQALTISNAFKKLFTYNSWDYYVALASTTGWTYDSNSQKLAASCPVIWYEASSSSQTVHYLSSMIIIH